MTIFPCLNSVKLTTVANDQDHNQIFDLDCPQQSIPIDYRHNLLPTASLCSTTLTRILKLIMISEPINRPGQLLLATLILTYLLRKTAETAQVIAG